MDKLKMHSPNITQQNIDKLLELFPNCKTEKQDANGELCIGIDFDLLKQELSKNIVEGPKERYQLNWPGKKEALLAANAPIAKTLRPCREESVDFDSTQNLFVDGDNLEALKLLQETYLGKVKMIYIDPPYNTGKDFIYADNFAESTGEYLRDSGQKDDEGNRLVANAESNGRFHSDWLSMIYSRLKLARNLLKDDGIIFISIDNELANLTKICNEIFGEVGFIDIFSWQKTTTPPNLSKYTKKSCEYILCYQKIDCGTLKGLVKKSKSSNGLMNQTNPISKLEFPAGVVKTKLPDGFYKAGRYGTESYDIDLLDDASVKNGIFTESVMLKGKFKWSQGYLEEMIRDGATILIQTKAFSPSYEKLDYEPERPWNIINSNFNVGTNENGGSEVDSLFRKNFSENLYPKPTSLLKYLINTNVEKSDIVLDFFAGSGSTAHAVMQLNSEDKGDRRFIMVQLSEKCNEKSEAYKSGYKTVAEISKERIRRAGKKIKEENPEAIGLDTGFRVLKIDSSNMNEVHYAPDSVAKVDLLDQIDHIKIDRSAEDLLFQVILDWGVDLSLPICKETIEGKEVYFVNDDDLVACFDKGIDEALIKALAAKKPLRVVFRDDGFVSDSVKINVEQIFKQLAPATDIKAI